MEKDDEQIIYFYHLQGRKKENEVPKSRAERTGKN